MESLPIRPTQTAILARRTDMPAQDHIRAVPVILGLQTEYDTIQDPTVLKTLLTACFVLLQLEPVVRLSCLVHCLSALYASVTETAEIPVTAVTV